jgi:hypothetical protein
LRKAANARAGIAGGQGMESERKEETIKGVAVRTASVMLAAWLCFPKDDGGDLLIQPGDEIVLVVKTRKQKRKAKSK